VNSAIVRLSSLCPLVVITHSPWDRRARRAAGSITQAANFATTMHFEKVPGKTSSTFVHVSVDSKVGAEQADFSLKLETDGGEIRGIAYEGAGPISPFVGTFGIGAKDEDVRFAEDLDSGTC
jgi:hypothetical protein